MKAPERRCARIVRMDATSPPRCRRHATRIDWSLVPRVSMFVVDGHSSSELVCVQ